MKIREKNKARAQVQGTKILRSTRDIVFFKIIIMDKGMRYINLDFKLGNIIIRMPAEECFSAH